MTRPRRRRLAVEVIQSSAMDCGPAALKCLLDSHGISVSYGRLRETCQTEVDGTSVDTLEEVAVALGLDAEQNLIPTDHLFLREAEALPAIAIVRSPGGLTHFVIVWSHAAGVVQIMDPAVGRQFVGRDAFLRRLFVHRMPVPLAGLREWLGSPEFLGPLRRRASALGVPADRTAAWLAGAAVDLDILPLARIDAAVRMAAALTDADALARGGEATRFIDQTLRDTAGLAGPALFARLPEQFFTAVPGTEQGTGLLRGAVIVRVRGVRQAMKPEDMSRGTLPAGLAAALGEPQVSPLRRLAELVRADGPGIPGVLTLGVALAAAAVVAEALVLRAMVDVGARIGVGEQRLGAAAAIVLFFAALLLLELPLAGLVQRIGRRLSARLRIAFLTRIPRLGDRYLASRPISDMADRCHRGHALRALPVVAAHLLRGACELIFTAAALIWLDPAGAPWILLAALTVVVVPLALLPTLSERTLKVRSHVGALGRFYFDALLGLTALRTHAAERSLLREHEGLLVEWSQAQRGSLRVQVVATGISAAVGLGLAAALFAAYTARHAEPAGALLLLYWALALPAIGAQVAAAAYEVPGLRTTALRLLEPLHDEDEGEVASGRPLVGAARGGGVAARGRGGRGRAHDLARDRSRDRGGGARGDRRAVGGGQVELAGAAARVSSPERRGAGGRRAPARRGDAGGAARGDGVGRSGGAAVERDAAGQPALREHGGGAAAAAGARAGRPDGGARAAAGRAAVAARRGRRAGQRRRGSAGPPRSGAAARAPAPGAARRAAARARSSHPRGAAGELPGALAGQHAAVRDARHRRGPRLRSRAGDRGRSRGRGRRPAGAGRRSLVAAGGAAARGERAAARGLGRSSLAPRGGRGRDAGERRGGADVSLVKDTWPIARAGEALAALATHAGLLAHAQAPAAPDPSLLAELEGAALERWFLGASAGLGLEAEAIDSDLAGVDDLLRGSPPALLRLGGERRRAVAGAARRVADVDGAAADLRPRRVALAELRRVVCEPVIAAARPQAESLAERTGIRGARRARAIEALLRQHFGARRVGRAFLLRASPATSWTRLLRAEGVLGRVVALVGLHALELALTITAWWLIGGLVFAGRSDPGWSHAWLLLLLSLVPCRMGQTAISGEILRRAGALLKRRLLVGAMAMTGDLTRREGAGALLGRVLETAAVESLGLRGGLVSAIALLQLIAAVPVLAAGPAPALHLTLLVGGRRRRCCWSAAPGCTCAYGRSSAPS
jgi:hypothetical protein